MTGKRRWTSGSMMWGKVSALKFSWFQWEFTFRMVQSSSKTNAEGIYRVGARYVPFVSNDLLASSTAWLLSGAGSLLGKDKSHRQLDFAWVASFDCLQARQLVSSSLMHNRLAGWQLLLLASSLLSSSLTTSLRFATHFAHFGTWVSGVGWHIRKGICKIKQSNKAKTRQADTQANCTVQEKHWAFQ